MIIESVTNTTSKTIHVINFTKSRKVKVVSFTYLKLKGRAQNAEVRITDISVSRYHTMIKLTKFGEVVISDNCSKFGTLVQLREPYGLPLNSSKPLYL